MNVISCIFIGLAHTILIFQNYFPLSTAIYVLLVYRFITSFCGSLSSFAGLTDDTLQLFHAKGAKRVWQATKNIFYNLFLCLIVFFIVVLSLRMAIFFRYWGPETAVLYFCGGTFFAFC